MKKVLLVVSLLLTTCFHLFAQSQKATVYLLRADGPDDAVPYFTYLDQVL